jgi:RNase adaptor protein for sRNA GlmZ degradation
VSLFVDNCVSTCDPDTAKASDINTLLTPNNTERPEEQSTQLIVGCFCALGKHRNVAFVEELARKQWPDDWDVEVRHRDVDQNKSKRTNRQHKQSRKDKVDSEGKNIKKR